MKMGRETNSRTRSYHAELVSVLCIQNASSSEDT